MGLLAWIRTRSVRMATLFYMVANRSIRFLYLSLQDVRPVAVMIVYDQAKHCIYT